MLASSFNCLNEIIFVTFDAYDIGDFLGLDMADIVLKQLIVGYNSSVLISDHIKQINRMF